MTLGNSHMKLTKSIAVSTWFYVNIYHRGSLVKMSKLWQINYSTWVIISKQSCSNFVSFQLFCVNGTSNQIDFIHFIRLWNILWNGEFRDKLIILFLAHLESEFTRGRNGSSVNNPILYFQMLKHAKKVSVLYLNQYQFVQHRWSAKVDRLTYYHRQKNNNCLRSNLKMRK